MKRLTVVDIIKMRPCSAYTESRLGDLAAGREALTLLEICALDIPAADRVWVMLQDEVLPDAILREFACRCAERVLPIYERVYPGDDRPQNAIETRRKWGRGEATDAELNAAAEAAEAAAAAAAAAAWAEAAAAAAAAAAAWAARAEAARAAAWAAWAAAAAAAAAAAWAWAEEAEAAAAEAAWAEEAEAAAAEAAWAAQLVILTDLIAAGGDE